MEEKDKNYQLLEFLKAATIYLSQLEGLSEFLRPLIIRLIKTFKTFSPEVKEILEEISNYRIDRSAEHIFRLERHGFTREEAILLYINSKISSQIMRDKLQDSLKAANTKRKKKQKKLDV